MNNTTFQLKLVSAGADAIMVYLGEGVSVSVNQRVLAAVAAVDEQLADVVIDRVPSYNSLMVYYDILRTDEREMRDRLQTLLTDRVDGGADTSADTVTESNADNDAETQGECHRIPVYYDTQVGPDLERVAKHHNQSIDDVIRAHTEHTYRVYAMGFAPGFAYLGEVPESLRTPRLDNPRKRITAGSVAIAEHQTAVYPSQSPGGWNIIGRTATQLYDPASDVISPLKVGDTVQFYAVDKDGFDAAGGNLEALT